MLHGFEIEFVQNQWIRADVGDGVPGVDRVMES
jgi:hypothetical protein